MIMDKTLSSGFLGLVQITGSMLAEKCIKLSEKLGEHFLDLCNNISAIMTDGASMKSWKAASC